MDSFYDDLPSFADFHRLGDARFYRPLPADWFVVISDLRGSTKAIEEGRYQEVNTLGAASIAVVQSLFPGRDIPFVFGGDGASFLVPGSAIGAVQSALLKLRNFARVNFAMELRVGSVPMSEVLAQGQVIEVAKFSIADKKAIALMRGGGLSFAESLIKGSPEKYCLNNADGGTLEQLAGLSCRWKPLDSQRGSVLSILVKPIIADPKLLDQILARFEEIFDGGMAAANPVNMPAARYKSGWQVLRTEAKFTRSFFSQAFAWRLISIALSVWAFKWGRKAPFDHVSYTAQIPSHSDYRKFDDMLRMILDCTPAQIDAVTAYLTKLHAERKIVFGLHQSPHALMTCLVETLQEGGHIHFIDGGDGGYAMAAKQMKRQLAEG